MTLKPWRELITPHKDVLDGTFKQSEFAADLTQVQNGTATDEYKNPEKFFRRTYITEGMRLLLDSVARRLAGKGGDPVIQLQTSFGGGKTHTLLAVYHLAKREVSPDKMNGISSILDKAGLTDLPTARLAIIDGNNISPSKARKRDSFSVNTLWGEIAWQLLGEPGYQIVSAADKDGTSPGKEALIEILKKASPCVILLDELVAYIRQLETGKSYVGGTFESNLSFIQALTEAMKAVPNSLLLASLPESEIETAGPMGKLALESLEKYFARVESVWKPVATEESFEIVKRRLFEASHSQGEIEKVCRTYFDYYIENNNRFPPETQTNRYQERLIQSYPIHPEVFDRLYSDWSTLEKFQRTRGVLQYLAIIIHRLWNSENRDSLIMPGSLPLEDANVRTKSIHYLPQGWEPVIESEIDGQRSVAAEIDGKEPRIGSLQAARRVARTIFLGSAPASGSQGIKGVAIDHILLGSAQPGQVVAVYEDALKRLADRLQYLFPGNNKYWFDTRPNLRREMEGRKNRLDYKDHVVPCIKEFLTQELRGNSNFAGIHIFTPSSDIPDDINTGVRLVVAEPDSLCAYSKANAKEAFNKAYSVLERRGEQPRQRKNRLIFLFPDYESLTRLRDCAKTYLSWNSIIDDIGDGRLNHDMHITRQAQQALEQSRKVLSQSLRETYKWLINPYEEMVAGKPNLNWEVSSITASGSSYVSTIETKLREEEWVIYEWSPIHLSNTLKQWYFKNGQVDVITKKLMNDFASYLYLPRLSSEQVLKDTISQGVIGTEFFGYAQGKTNDHYIGLVIGTPTYTVIDESSLLITSEKAIEIKRIQEQEATSKVNKDSNSGASNADNSSTTDTNGHIPLPASLSSPKATYFFATKELSARTPKVDFNDVIENIFLQLSSRSSTSVSISIEISANDEVGFEKDFANSITNKCNELKFKQSSFS